MDEFKPMDGKSEFNSAIAVMNRMNFWFARAEEAQQKRDYSEWFMCLVNNHMLLADDMKKEDYIASDKNMDERNAFVCDCIRNKGKSVSYIEFKKFVDWQLLLMRVFKYAGYKTKIKDDPRFSK